MKNHAYKMIGLVMLLTVIGLSSAQAQTSSAEQMTADIPFAFQVGNQTMPAGKYTVRCINPASDMKVLQLRNASGRQNVLVQTSSVIGTAKQQARLVFNRYGERHYLAQAWLTSDNTGLQARRSRSEKAAASELASIGRAIETVALSRSVSK